MITIPVKNSMLATLNISHISVHSGVTGADGTENELEVPRAIAAFSAPENGKINLTSQVTMVIPAMGIVRYIGYWNGPIFLLSQAVPEMLFSSEGNLNLLAGTTYIEIPTQ